MSFNMHRASVCTSWSYDSNIIYARNLSCRTPTHSGLSPWHKQLRILGEGGAGLEHGRGMMYAGWDISTLPHVMPFPLFFPLPHIRTPLRHTAHIAHSLSSSHSPSHRPPTAPSIPNLFTWQPRPRVLWFWGAWGIPNHICIGVLTSPAPSLLVNAGREIKRKQFSPVTTAFGGQAPQQIA